MEKTTILNTIVAFMMVFYIATSIVPDDRTHFFMDAQHMLGKTTFNFIKQKDGYWKVISDYNPNEPLYYAFDDQLNFSMRRRQSGKQDTTLSLNKLIQIKKNHQDWSKVTEVLVKTRSKTPPERLSVDILKKGEKKRVIIVATNAKKNDLEVPTMHLNWE